MDCSILFEDGWEYGSFHEHIGSIHDIGEASLKGLFELLLHAKEESAKKVIIWSENNTFLEQLTESSIRRKKPLRDLFDSFVEVRLINIDEVEIENLEDLRESVFRSARSGAQYKTRRKRYKVILRASEKDEPKEVINRRWDELAKIMAECAHRYMTRPPDEKIKDAEEELKEIENNLEEQPDHEAKRAKLLGEMEVYKKEKVETDKRRAEIKNQKDEQEAKRKAEDERIKKALMSRGLCIECGKKIAKDWKFCPFCSAIVKILTQ